MPKLRLVLQPLRADARRRAAMTWRWALRARLGLEISQDTVTAKRP